VKTKSLHISIPQPCHEQWNNMNPTESGAFCHSCQKEVIDFSAMTDREVIEYLAKHETGCGRFRRDQLDTKLAMAKVDNGLFKWKAMLLGLLPFIGLKSALAIPNLKVATNQNSKLPAENEDSLMHISGAVMDAQGVRIKGVSIDISSSTGQLRGTRTYTDSSGIFSFNVDRSVIESGAYSFKVGYQDSIVKTVPITNGRMQDYLISLDFLTPYFRADDVQYVVNGRFHSSDLPAKKRHWFKRAHKKNTNS
jgi:hypothetical protein